MRHEGLHFNLSTFTSIQTLSVLACHLPAYKDKDETLLDPNLFTMLPEQLGSLNIRFSEPDGLLLSATRLGADNEYIRWQCTLPPSWEDEQKACKRLKKGLVAEISLS